MNSEALSPRMFKVQSYCGKAVQTIDGFPSEDVSDLDEDEVEDEPHPVIAKVIAIISSAVISGIVNLRFIFFLYLFMGSAFLCAAAAGSIKESVGNVQMELVHFLDLLHERARGTIAHMKKAAAACALHVHVIVTAAAADDLISGLPVLFSCKAMNSTSVH